MALRNEGTITRLLVRVGSGDEQARDALWSTVYSELREMAAAMMARERPGHPLQPTALIHEAYVRLLGAEKLGRRDRAYFFGAAALAMRRILIEHARRNSAECKQADANCAAQLTRMAATSDTLSEHLVDQSAGRSANMLLALDEALDDLRKHDEKVFDVIMLRYFAGLTTESIAESLGVSARTVRRYWTYGRTWLYRRIENNRT